VAAGSDADFMAAPRTGVAACSTLRPLVSRAERSLLVLGVARFRVRSDERMLPPAVRLPIATTAFTRAM